MNLARHYASPLEGMRTASPPPGATHRDLPRFDQLYAKQPQRETSAEAQDLLRSQELFLSVVLDWQRHDLPQHTQVQRVQHYAEPTYSSSFESSEGSDHEGGQALLSFTKAPPKPIVDDPSPTNLPRVHHMPLNHPSGPPALSLNNLLPVPSKKIGVYTPRSRRVLIEKYMEKRTKRLSRKKVRYRVRKTLANARPRVKGRFVKTEQPLTAAAVEEMEKRQQQPITTLMRRRNHDINWEDLAANLEQSMLALLPRQHNESPLPDVQAELINLLADAEDECTQETYLRALHGCALYVALCLSLYASLRHPSLWDMDDEPSPVLHHYLADIKQLWLRRKTKKQQTFDAFEGTVHGLAAVICLGYDDAKRYLKPLTL
ncbi:hypothetical protein SPRG_01526 [Saprolegnia parasitica CBS 223.65]|uniref:CCT domain-containing protein n=1 Tax=Saprolegnia parasitica (strain CBS 223.65) TaxID=695850 RepID=A0A067CYQ1_SAPPC|nr:hypothetical protein SPRG_01526 [Saprolegnia parasitica CBS 223.65]KDO34390.1 hypothetical protein SPRG_01526 [Saprolegnia parasitica CBS 223.65]|eukprot:XP_012195126.1 hypothetical protein SPRG_01526 [Saprolegnia parasitica CBS 223.65]